MVFKARTKLFYLAALYVLAMLVVITRLYHMQVLDTENYALDAERTRTRIELLFPSRGNILDARGSVLATNELVWDVTWNVADLLDPTTVVRRASHNESAWTTSADERIAFYREHVQPILDKDYPTPQRARRFFDLWQLRRSHPICAEDRQVMVTQLSRLLGLQESDVEHQLTLLEDEVDAMVAELFAPDAGEPGRVKIATTYYNARAALSDPEYWETIRRFPKSLRFEHNLRHRLDRMQKRIATSQRTGDALTDSTDPGGYLAALVLTAQEELAALRASLPQADAAANSPEALPGMELASPPVAAFHILPTPEELATIESEEAIRDLESWLRDLQLAQANLAAGVSTDEVADALVQEVHDDKGSTLEREDALRHLEGRLRRLRRVVFQNPDADETKGENFEVRKAWTSRWASYLDPNGHQGADARLRDNPIELMSKLPRERVELLEVNRDILCGLHAVPRSERIYPHIDLAPHLLGSVGLPGPDVIGTLVDDLRDEPNLATLHRDWFQSDDELFDRTFRGSLALQPIGQNGVESFYQQRLAGVPGARVAYRDARGNIRSIEGKWQPISSPDMRLTLDSDVQEFAKSVIRKYELALKEKATKRSNTVFRPDLIPAHYWSFRGSIVLLDIDTGAVICMVDFPSYDPAKLRASGPEGDAYREKILRGDDNLKAELNAELPWLTNTGWLMQAPMFSRSVSSHHAPGSTFKIISSIMMLEESGVIPSPQHRIDLSPLMERKRSGSWLYRGETGIRLTTGHPVLGPINVMDAIEQSSNEFYWHYSQFLPGENARQRFDGPFKKWANAFGFGEKPGLDIPAWAQTAGTLPAGLDIQVGELAQNCMGQGKMGASPLQLARAMCAVGSRGRLPTPHLNADWTDAPVREIEVSQTTWNALHQGMANVVYGSAGSARDSRVARRMRDTMPVCAKTGTAENDFFYGPQLYDADGNELERKLYRIPNHAWFAGFAPAHEPKVAFAILGEFSGLVGGHLADPVLEVVEYALQRQAEDAQD